MIDCFETISQPKSGLFRVLGYPVYFDIFVIEQEEPYEGRLSRTVLWERRGEIPLRDPTMCHFLKTTILTMFKLLFGQQALWTSATLFLRVWVGVIFVHYGLSLFYDNNMQDFTGTLMTVNIPFPNLSAYLCKTTEFFGGLFLILGFLKRISCSFLIIDMFVATFIFHKGLLLQNGMTTFLLLVCCLTILLSATDKLSIDWLIIKHKIKIK